MSVRFSVKLEGAKELGRKLGLLPEKLATKTIRKALKEAATPMLHQARALCPIDTGDLLLSMKIKTSRKRGVLKARVAAGDSPKKSKSGKATKAKKQPARDTFYARFVEFGHRSPGGSDVPPVPFMRPAFDEHQASAISNIMSDIRGGVEEAMNA